jgi:hypothetical protein
MDIDPFLPYTETEREGGRKRNQGDKRIFLYYRRRIRRFGTCLKFHAV